MLQRKLKYFGNIYDIFLNTRHHILRKCIAFFLTEITFAT